VTIADNGSSDSTWRIAQQLAARFEEVQALRLDEKGRGRALATAWLASEAMVVAYMDVDLSTDLKALLPLVAPIVSGHSDVAIGSRLARGARVRRGPKRELISRGYNLLLKATLRVGFSDAQCGFKAVRAETARQLLPVIADNGFFFDTELLVLAQRSGLRITEVPVDWTDDADSRVAIVPTALADLRGIWRLLGARELLMFSVIGVLSTAAYAALFWGFRSFAPAAVANLIALLATAFANTAANRRLTFGVAGREGLARDHAGGLVAFVFALAITNLAMAGLTLAEPHAGREL
jgi:putative flippase GtrA